LLSINNVVFSLDKLKPFKFTLELLKIIKLEAEQEEASKQLSEPVAILLFEELKLKLGKSA